ncbi:MAG: hypothetical protein CMJ78_15790 [Planctomycetaceae bacterium]|nr:hypothetical protein [Planctomycetaceae bacterium]
MRFVVREVAQAQRDISSIFEWLWQRSQSGAANWLKSYDAMVERLTEVADSFGEAHENHLFEKEIKQAFFKTRRGQTYRAIFYIEETTAYILRVRGPGQAPIKESDIN